ncbi:MAG: hypothetical protein ACJAWQ_002561 [Paraglaciecola sp.]|jgi:hypothetical protein
MGHRNSLYQLSGIIELDDALVVAGRKVNEVLVQQENV